MVVVRLVGILCLLVTPAVLAWSPIADSKWTRGRGLVSSSYPRLASLWNDKQPFDSSTSSTSSTSAVTEIDVSDLGLTMDDLNAPIPSEFWQVTETSGYESTSRIPSVQDDACFWTETPDEMSVILAIPGLRGQPSMAISVLTSKNTISVSVFGRIVWSAILRGETIPESATFESRDGSNFIPIIEYSVRKTATGSQGRKRWDGFILQVGEDSLL